MNVSHHSDDFTPVVGGSHANTLTQRVVGRLPLFARDLSDTITTGTLL